MTRVAKLEALSRFLQDYEVGMTVAEYANKILDALEGKMKAKGKKPRKGC